MKKLNKIVLLLILVISIFYTTKAYASGSISAPSSVYTGEAFSIKLNSHAASWEYHVKASGAGVSCSINQADVSEDLSEVTKSWATSCTPTSTGSVTITLTGNWTNASGVTSNVTQTIYVNVVDRPATPTTQPATQPTTKQTTTRRTTQAPTTTQQVEETTTIPAEEPTTEVKGEEDIINPITNIKVVGYDIKFDANKYEYDINVGTDVTALYIMVEGENLEAANPGEIDIKDKDSVEVSIPIGDKTFKYIFKIHRLTYGDAESQNIIRGLTATLIIMCLTMVVIVCISVFVIVGLKKKTTDNTIIPINDVIIDNNNQNM